jgi:hypothetical protein
LQPRSFCLQEKLDSNLLICPSCQSVARAVVDRGGKSVAFGGRPASNEGRIMIVIYARRDAVDAAAPSCIFARTSGVEAYGEVVWS